MSKHIFVVSAPPTFIQRLPPYTGAMGEIGNFTINCQVECSPMCDIVWLKDGAAISEDDDRYTMVTKTIPANYATNDFESVNSTLVFNIHNWRSSGKLDRELDNANYTCQSTGNLVGRAGVKSTTYFRVECKLRIEIFGLISIINFCRPTRENWNFWQYSGSGRRCQVRKDHLWCWCISRSQLLLDL